MEDQRRVLGQQDAEELGKARRVLVHEAAVGLLHQRHRVLRRQRPAFALQLDGALHHRGFDGQLVVLHLRQQVGELGALALAAEIHRARDAQGGQACPVVRREPGQVVGAEDAPPRHFAPAVAGVAAQVAEIAGTRQRHGAGQRFGRGRPGGEIGCIHVAKRSASA